MQVTHVDIMKDRQKTGWTKSEIELDHRRTPLYSHQITRRLETGRSGPGGTKLRTFREDTAQIPKRTTTKKKGGRKNVTSSTGVLRHQNPPITENDSRRGEDEIRMMQKKENVFFSKKSHKSPVLEKCHQQKELLFAEPHLRRTDCAH